MGSLVLFMIRSKSRKARAQVLADEGVLYPARLADDLMLVQLAASAA
jgi:hypothetical protein